jgi:hypothetical protein
MHEMKHNTNPAAMGAVFDLEVETMFNPSPDPVSKADFLNAQDEKNQMFPYGDAFAYDAEAEQLCSDAIDAYFQACLAKIKQAEASAGEF